MQHTTNKWFSIVFCVVLIGALFVNLLVPPVTFSENENRTLAQLPQADIESIASGKFMEDFESYSSDQFAGRDFWVSVKANLEKLSGKKENNGVYFAEDGYLIEKLDALNESVLNANFDAIKKADSLGKYQISFMMIPTAFEILQDKLPSGAYAPVQRKALDMAQQAFEGTGVNFIDPSPLLQQHKDEYIYYRTDHHQTPDGSYLSYRSWCESMGVTPMEQDAFTRQTLTEEFLGTTWSKATLFNAQPDTISAYIPKQDYSYHLNFLDTGTEMDGLYATDHLNTKDKYSVFLDGNHAMMTIHSSVGNGKTLAVFKDSYAHSILPFLANHYETIHVIDLRYYNMDPLAYLDQNGITDVLILYNAANFMTDTNPVKLGAFIK